MSNKISNTSLYVARQFMHFAIKFWESKEIMNDETLEMLRNTEKEIDAEIELRHKKIDEMAKKTDFSYLPSQKSYTKF